ncbi:polyphosphate kinase 1 [Puniceicoccus vermicola]|uniref:Polyphosphate kinase n=1 Tax=Puniceicoccus vermicola TaxID=388746 RepID=A0A7X1AXY0_9BACT|nr:polyphosphate kinase 1 [Puniceicoccus vermicola]
MTTRKRTNLSLPEGVKSPFHGDRPFFNRELSWLAFNQRVLEQATNPDYPLLERVRFIAFVSSNLDEFFEIRVAGLMQKVDSGITRTGLDGLEPKEQLNRIRKITSRLVNDQYACWNNQLVPDLKEENIVFKKVDQLTKAEDTWVQKYFEESVFPVLTPLAIDPGHPFPQITNKSLNILACIRNHEEGEEDLLAILPVPRILPRIVEIPSKGTKYRTYVFLSDVIGKYASQLFPGFETLSTHAFRVTRNSDLYIDEEEVDNLLQTIEEELHKLKKGASVRLEIADTVPENALERLLQAINLSKESVFRVDGPINLLRVMGFYDMVDRPDLKFPPFPSSTPQALAESTNIFDTISREDFLLHHPFESFTPVVEFLRQAGKDPKVYAIKQTLYRTSGDSPIIEALIEASTQGKQVTALIELKARFDEANNIHWARQLEDAGVHVVYGLVGLKTHCKTCLVIRREPDNTLRRFVHMGTGNYNPKTARLYTDYSYFTAKPHITEEVADLFNSLTGFARSPSFKHLLVAPFNLHASIQKFIRQEATNARAGKPARIIAKVNSLIDQETIESLYEASQAGVQIDLIVRGICGLIPGVKGLSENIRVRSILGRYLEHSRIYYFQNHGRKARIYVGSADWMPRNFFRRIEAVFPLEETEHRKHVLETLRTYLKDNTHSKQLRPTGTYAKVPVSKRSTPFSAQHFFMEQALEASKRSSEELEAGKPTLKLRGEPRNSPSADSTKKTASDPDAASNEK